VTDAPYRAGSSDALVIDDVSKRYGRQVALDHMSFEVRASEIFGFVGSNGAGKTTTMRIALGVLAADTGRVTWRGEPVTLATRRRIGYMPEERGLYPTMRVGEQLRYFAQLHGVGRARSAEAVTRWLTRLGVEERRNDTVHALSLGNQQRVQLAAALVHDPEILVLDEPFSGLDPVAVDVMSQVLRDKAAAGVPVIFSSHQLELVERLCDRVGIVQRGRMVACGTVDELRGTAPRRLLVDAPAAPPGWADGLPGVVGSARRGSATLLGVTPDVDDQLLLRAALAESPVHAFTWERPSLVELFRSVVTAPGAAPAPAAGQPAGARA
jgi:ABC-2 type transport system ATP-binding protein